jgi:hypothetical protein
MKALISGFLRGVTGTISGLLPTKRSGRKTASRNTGSARKHQAGRVRADRKLRPKKTQRVGSGTGRKGHFRKVLKPFETTTDNSHLAWASRTVIYSCPACGLEAPETSMVEHLRGSPIHQRGRAALEQTTHPRVDEQPAGVAHEEDSRDSLRSLLQILLPPRAFGRRHQQKTANLSPH